MPLSAFLYLANQFMILLLKPVNLLLHSLMGSLPILVVVHFLLFLPDLLVIRIIQLGLHTSTTFFNILALGCRQSKAFELILL